MATRDEELKTQGNKHFTAREYAKAADLYSQAIEVNSSVAVYWSNRAACQLQLEAYGAAVSDATQAIELDNDCIKAYYRRACALVSLGKNREALKDLKIVATREPGNKDAVTKLQECQKTIRAEAFAKAIEGDETSLIDKLNWRVMSVPEAYDGPRWDTEDEFEAKQFTGAPQPEEERKASTAELKMQLCSHDTAIESCSITRDFVMKMIDMFRAQQRLPSRYLYRIVMACISRWRRHMTTVIDIGVGSHCLQNTSNSNDFGRLVQRAKETPQKFYLANPDKLTIVGDIHGQYFDLLRLFELNGYPSETNGWCELICSVSLTHHPSTAYLFNGDFVDRGSFSLEVMLTLMAFHLLYPHRVFCLRGNHESKSLNAVYGFYNEVRAKVDAQCQDLFAEAFNLLPIAAVVHGDARGPISLPVVVERGRTAQVASKEIPPIEPYNDDAKSQGRERRVLVLHGGLPSKDGVKLDDIRSLFRVTQPDSDLLADLLWADPQPQNGRTPSKRGVSMHFGPNVTRAFCRENGLDYIVRSHEVKDEGFEVMHEGQCITVFSAPKYCGFGTNLASIIRLDTGLCPTFHKFEAVPHPQAPRYC